MRHQLGEMKIFMYSSLITIATNYAFPTILMCFFTEYKIQNGCQNGCQKQRFTLCIIKGSNDEDLKVPNIRKWLYIMFLKAIDIIRFLIGKSDKISGY